MMFWAHFLATTFEPAFDFRDYNVWSKPIAILFGPCYYIDGYTVKHDNDNYNELTFNGG